MENILFYKKQIKKLLEDSGKIEDLRKSEISIKDFICFLKRDALNNQCSPEHLIKEDFLSAKMDYAFNRHHIMALSVGIAETLKEKENTPIEDTIYLFLEGQKSKEEELQKWDKVVTQTGIWEKAKKLVPQLKDHASYEHFLYFCDDTEKIEEAEGFTPKSSREEWLEENELEIIESFAAYYLDISEKEFFEIKVKLAGLHISQLVKNGWTEGFDEILSNIFLK